jgi:glyoxylase-like metal-dependent hydrolase (beta-lactamase superfamily II)
VRLLTFSGGGFQQNGWVAVCEATDEALVVDPGAAAPEMCRAIEADRLRVKAIVLTHAHLDHVEGVPDIRTVTDAPALLHPADGFLYRAVAEQAAAFGMAVPELPSLDGELAHGDVLTFGECAFHVRHAPGHSPGHVVLVNEDERIAIVADVVFAGSIGRTDLPGGDYQQLIQSIRAQVLTLPDDTRLLTGHGPETTVGRERRTNPFLIPWYGGEFV